MDPEPDFLDPDLDFLPIRIRTWVKKSDPDPDKRNRIRDTGYHLERKALWNLCNATFRMDRFCRLMDKEAIKLFH